MGHSHQDPQLGICGSGQLSVADSTGVQLSQHTEPGTRERGQLGTQSLCILLANK